MPILRHHIFFFFLLLFSFSSYSQKADTSYSNIDEVLQNPSVAQYLYVDATMGDDSLFFANINKLRNLKILTVNGMSGNKLIDNLWQLRGLEQLNIIESPDLNYRKLFVSLASFNYFTTLCIKDCELNRCPPEVRNLKKLQTLIITDNDDFNTKDLVKNIAKLPKLTNLALPINQITELPENIGLLTQIEVLDISNNWITDLPDNIADMKSLKNIDVSGNIIINPLSTLGKLKSLNIRYIGLDKGLTDDEKIRLSKLFPNTQIMEVNAMNEEDTMDIPIPIDTSSLSNIQTPVLTKQPETDSVQYGVINVEGDAFQIYSPAYMHYAAIFNSPYLQYEFDSITFDERFLDTNYVNIYKISSRPRCAIPIFMQKYKGQIAFSFFDFPRKGFMAGLFHKQNTSFNSFINKLYYELNVFKSVVWLYKGDMTKRKFRQTYALVKRPKFIQKSRPVILWADARITYNQPEKDFTILLKDNSGFVEFKALPINRTGKMTIEENQKNYTKVYAKYLSTLIKRKNRFHKSLIKEKSLYDAALNKSILKTWTDFQNLYMSPEEKKLSREEWLEYYDKVIANEKKALYASPLTIENLERDLDINKYQLIGSKSITGSVSNGKYLGCYFIDQDSNLLVASKIILINTANRTYCECTGSLGADPSPLLLEPNSSISMVVQLRNGDMAVLKKDVFMKADFKNKTEFTFKTDRISKKLGSIGQVIDILNL